MNRNIVNRSLPYKPGQFFHNHHYRIRLTATIATTSATSHIASTTVNQVRNIRMGRPNAPVLIQSSSSSTSAGYLNGNQKWASSLAAQHHIKGDNAPPKHSPPSPIAPKDKAMILGMSIHSLFVWK
jgi:hypothetical protein